MTTGKYKININPDYCTVPTIDLIDGQSGSIIYVAVLDNESVLYTKKGVIDFSECDERILANFDRNMIRCLNGDCGLPLEELEETKKLEKEYRENNST